MAMLNNQMVEKRDIGRFSMAMFDNQRVNSSIRTPNYEKFMGFFGPIIEGPCNFLTEVLRNSIFIPISTHIWTDTNKNTKMSYTVHHGTHWNCPGIFAMFLECGVLWFQANMDSHSAGHHVHGTDVSENAPNAETLATVGTPVSKGVKIWGEGKLLRQDCGWWWEKNWKPCNLTWDNWI